MAGPTTFSDRFTSRLGSTIGLNTEQPTAKNGGFDINSFKSKINEQNGILPTNLFLVNITPISKAKSRTSLMSSAQNASKVSTETLSFFCSRAEIPGITLGTETHQIQTPGPLQEFVSTALPTSETQLSFLGDGNGNILNFFSMWMNSIAGWNEKDKTNYFRLSYRDDYLCEITILVFNQTSDIIMKYKLYDAFPVQIQNIQLDWAQQDTIMEIPIAFFFKTWSTDRFDASAPDGTETELTFIQKALKLGTAVQTIAALKSPKSIGDAVNVVNNAHVTASTLTSFF